MDTKPLGIGTILKNRYRITRLVAGGGMSWVYQAEEMLTDGSSRCWAIKELRPDQQAPEALREARALFEQEANILVRLDHPNLPKVVAYFQEDGRSYLVMEFVAGESLEKRLELANGPLPERDVLDWAIQVCDVLEYLHSQPRPIIFRDLKPSNIMLTPEGRVMLIDFGIARTYKAGQRFDTLSMGSENYAAPEQWGETQSDPRADIYGLGATMYHLLSNVAPVPAHVPSPRLPLAAQNPAVSPDVAAAVERAMAPNRADRYSSAAEMRATLLACLPRRERRRLEARREAMARQSFQPSVGQEHSTSAVARGPVCSACGAANRPGANFCRRCGHPISTRGTLRVTSPASKPLEFAICRRLTLVGRPGGTQPVDLDLSPCDPEGYVSRNHARIALNRGQYRLIDLDSANGTYLNGTRLAPRIPYILRPGDRIRLGQVELTFTEGERGVRERII